MIVKQRTTKRCPGCQQEQPQLLHVCGCGHEFCDIRAVREELEEQVRVGWSYVAIGATILLVCAAITIATSGLWIIGAMASVAVLVRGFVIRADARAHLRDIRGATGALPSAKIIR